VPVPQQATITISNSITITNSITGMVGVDVMVDVTVLVFVGGIVALLRAPSWAWIRPI